MRRGSVRRESVKRVSSGWALGLVMTIQLYCGTAWGYLPKYLQTLTDEPRSRKFLLRLELAKEGMHLWRAFSGALLALLLSMADLQQELLRKAWLEGRKGTLSALSEAKLWALREVWRAEHESDHGLQTFASGLVMKVGTNENPSQRAVGKFYEKVDADADWYPSKFHSFGVLPKLKLHCMLLGAYPYPQQGNASTPKEWNRTGSLERALKKATGQPGL